jgi:hypothetical protein
MAIDFMEFLPQITSFLFVFAIVYALLIFTGIFSATRRAAALLSIVIAFFAVMYSPLVSFLQDLLPLASIVLVVLFFIVFVKKLFIKEGATSTTRDSLPVVVLLAISLILIGIFWNEIAVYLPFGLSSETMLWLVGILIIILIFLAVYSHNPPPKQQE